MSGNGSVAIALVVVCGSGSDSGCFDGSQQMVAVTWVVVVKAALAPDLVVVRVLAIVMVGSDSCRGGSSCIENGRSYGSYSWQCSGIDKGIDFSTVTMVFTVAYLPLYKCLE